jgi:hypothetical protein
MSIVHCHHAPLSACSCISLLFDRFCRFEMHKALTADAQDVVKQLLMQDRTKRLGCTKGGAQAVQEHKWFADIDWAAVKAGKVRCKFHSDSFFHRKQRGTWRVIWRLRLYALICHTRPSLFLGSTTETGALTSRHHCPAALRPPNICCVRWPTACRTPHTKGVWQRRLQQL